MKTLLAIVLSVGIVACGPDDQQITPVPPPIVFLHVVKKNYSVLGTQYEKAYGIGRESNWLFPITNYRYSDWSYSYMDSIFSIPLNMNADSTAFCLLRKDNIRDTICLRYKRRMELFQFEMGLMFDSLQVQYKSTSLNKDSLVYIKKYDGMDLIIFRK